MELAIKYHPNFTTKECSVKGEWSDQDNLRISFACDVEMTKILANLPRLEWIHEWIGRDHLTYAIIVLVRNKFYGSSVTGDICCDTRIEVGLL